MCLSWWGQHSRGSKIVAYKSCGCVKSWSPLPTGTILSRVAKGRVLWAHDHCSAFPGFSATCLALHCPLWDMCSLSSIVTLQHLLTNDGVLCDKTVTAWGRRARWEPVPGHCHLWPQVLIPGMEKMEKMRWDSRKRTGQASRVSHRHAPGAMLVCPPLLSPNPQCLPGAHPLLAAQ